MKCYNCHYEVIDNFNFCPQCGSGQKDFICSCGNKVKPSERFCSNCGQKTNGKLKEKTYKTFSNTSIVKMVFDLTSTIIFLVALLFLTIALFTPLFTTFLGENVFIFNFIFTDFDAGGSYETLMNVIGFIYIIVMISAITFITLGTISSIKEIIELKETKKLENNNEKTSRFVLLTMAVLLIPFIFVTLKTASFNTGANFGYIQNINRGNFLTIALIIGFISITTKFIFNLIIEFKSVSGKQFAAKILNFTAVIFVIISIILFNGLNFSVNIPEIGNINRIGIFALLGEIEFVKAWFNNWDLSEVSGLIRTLNVVIYFLIILVSSKIIVVFMAFSKLMKSLNNKLLLIIIPIILILNIFMMFVMSIGVLNTPVTISLGNEWTQVMAYPSFNISARLVFSFIMLIIALIMVIVAKVFSNYHVESNTDLKLKNSEISSEEKTLNTNELRWLFNVISTITFLVAFLFLTIALFTPLFTTFLGDNVFIFNFLFTDFQGAHGSYDILMTVLGVIYILVTIGAIRFIDLGARSAIKEIKELKKSKEVRRYNEKASRCVLLAMAALFIPFIFVNLKISIIDTDSILGYVQNINRGLFIPISLIVGFISIIIKFALDLILEFKSSSSKEVISRILNYTAVFFVIISIILLHGLNFSLGILPMGSNRMGIFSLLGELEYFRNIFDGGNLTELNSLIRTLNIVTYTVIIFLLMKIALVLVAFLKLMKSPDNKKFLFYIIPIILMINTLMLFIMSLRNLNSSATISLGTWLEEVQVSFNISAKIVFSFISLIFALVMIIVSNHLLKSNLQLNVNSKLETSEDSLRKINLEKPTTKDPTSKEKLSEKTLVKEETLKEVNLNTVEKKPLFNLISSVFSLVALLSLTISLFTPLYTTYHGRNMRLFNFIFVYKQDVLGSYITLMNVVSIIYILVTISVVTFTTLGIINCIKNIMTFKELKNNNDNTSRYILLAMAALLIPFIFVNLKSGNALETWLVVERGQIIYRGHFLTIALVVGLTSIITKWFLNMIEYKILTKKQVVAKILNCTAILSVVVSIVLSHGMHFQLGMAYPYIGSRRIGIFAMLGQVEFLRNQFFNPNITDANYLIQTLNTTIYAFIIFLLIKIALVYFDFAKFIKSQKNKNFLLLIIPVIIILNIIMIFMMSHGNLNFDAWLSSTPSYFWVHPEFRIGVKPILVFILLICAFVMSIFSSIFSRK